MFLRKIKTILQQQKDELLQQANQKIAIDAEGDEVDKIQGNMLLGIASQLNMRNANKLQQIELAFKKIENGNYGNCQDCEEPILEKRLLSNPCVQSCIFCAERREAQAKQRKR